ncbi:unnamed protein product [Knipowitschia caucasica]
MTMIREVEAGVNFLKRLVVARGKLEEAKAEKFAEKLQQLLCDKYDHHWYPETPSKGQAFRCIRVNSGVLSDEAVLQACAQSELEPSELGLPRELTLWIDPLEVCARSGENSRPFTVATFSTEVDQRAEQTAQSPPPQDCLPHEPLTLDTSDYHSASSSCSSTTSSDTEEESKEPEEPSLTRKEVKDVRKEPAEVEVAYTMVPRARRCHTDRQKKVNYLNNMAPHSVQYYYQPPQVWSPYKKAPVFVTTVCAPPPPPPQPLVGYYLLPQAAPQFILPQAALQPWGAVKG